MTIDNFHFKTEQKKQDRTEPNKSEQNKLTGKKQLPDRPTEAATSVAITIPIPITMSIAVVANAETNERTTVVAV